MIDNDEGKVKVFLGSWKRYIPGWVHVDLYPQNDFTIRDDARTLKTFGKESVDVLASIHMLEHISHKDVDKMFQRWLEVIKPRGLAIVEVPDILAIAKAYVAWHENGCIWTDDQSLPLVRKKAAVMKPRAWQTLFGGTHNHRGHWNGSYWDSYRLKLRFTEAGFREVREEKPEMSLPTWGPNIRVVGVK